MHKQWTKHIYAGFILSNIDCTQVAYLIDLHTFLGRPFIAAVSTTPPDEDAVYGAFPQVNESNQEKSEK